MRTDSTRDVRKKRTAERTIQSMRLDVFRVIFLSQFRISSSVTFDNTDILLAHPLHKEHNLNFNQLLDATAYKEKYRADMIRWGEEKRNQDPGYFCQLISSGPGSEAPVWIISDARRKTDVQWFLDHYPGLVYTIRIEADEETRKQRGWIFTEGVDDAESECGLDIGVNFDCHIKNNGHQDQLENDLASLNQMITRKLKN
ncbi:hypothetical protein LSH36_645g01040 [Paralvinella palmiformis]|uniref:Phosphomevalonate kinase n=1 Tax=Paralvinella palmiformis TaxID=53620 RepID=A0AAD9MU62_9ANNE|nr:hypothetical protein LSH36_645g01040 [Paralvinella palmiformis]